MRDPAAVDLGLVVGGKLRSLRGRAGMTLEEVAVQMGSYRPIVGRLEAGRHLQDLEQIAAFCDAVGADVREVLAEVDRALELVDRVGLLRPVTARARRPAPAPKPPPVRVRDVPKSRAPARPPRWRRPVGT